MLDQPGNGGTTSPAGFVPVPGCSLFIPVRDLTRRLSDRDAGWFQNTENGSRTVDYGDNDALVSWILKSSEQNHVGLAVSSVIPGLSLGPALNFALDSFVKKQFNRDGAVRTDERIAVVSRSHAIRDYLAESVFALAQEMIPFMAVPTFRLKRNGDAVPARFGRYDTASFRTLKDIPAFLVYDLCPLDYANRMPPCAIVVAELAEHDTIEYAERLIKFAEASHSRAVFPIISYHDIEKRRWFESRGFTFVVATMPSGTSSPDFSFSKLSAATPPRTKLSVVACFDPISTALAIDGAYRLLREMWRACGSQQVPNQLRHAWSLLDELTAAPCRIATLEAVRRDSPRVTTIRYAIERLDYIDSSGLSADASTSIVLRWPHFIDAIKCVYDALYSRNPLYEKLAERVVDTTGTLTVLTRSDTAAAALRRDLMFDWGWQDEGNIRIGSTARLCRERIIARNIAAVGFNPGFRPHQYWAMLPESIEIFTYPHMLAAIADYQNYAGQNGVLALPTANEKALAELFDPELLLATGAPAYQLDCSDLSAEMRAFASHLHASKSASQSSGESLYDEKDFGLDDVTGPVASRPELRAEPTAIDLGDSEELAYVIVRLESGDLRKVPADAVFAVVPADSDELVKLKASALSQGDRVVLLSQDEHRSAFSLISERTRHLFPIDERALGLWESTIERLRAEYPPGEVDGVDRFCMRLEAEQCPVGRQSMRNWLQGRVHAPESSRDIAILMRVAGVAGDLATIAEAVSHELDAYRNFRRTIGRAIARRTVQRMDGRVARGRLDEEIDEVLELCDIHTVESVETLDPAA